MHFDYNLAKSEVNSILNTKLEKISYIKPKLENLINDLNDLSVGIGTPLKIEFQPDQPYYPLEISRVNTGYTNIEVYVITYYPVKDMNKILDVNGTKDISFDFGRKLEKYVDLKGANYVTRLKYVGYLDNLKNDAIFSNQKAVKKLGEGCQRDDECISNNCDGSWSICCKVNVFCSAIDNQMNCYNKCIEKSVSTTYTTTTFSNQKTKNKLGESCRNNDECISNNCDGSWSICCKSDVHCSPAENQMNCYNKCIEKSVSTTTTTSTIQEIIEKPKPNIFIRIYQRISNFFQKHIRKMV